MSCVQTRQVNNSEKRERDRLKKTAIKSGSSTSWSAYRSMRNHVNSSIKESKKSSSSMMVLLKVAKTHSTTQVWKHLRYVVPGKDKNNCINKIKVDDNIESTDPQVISDTLNNYFANIGPSLAKKIDEPDDLQGHDTNVFVNDTECTKFTLKPVSHECVLEHIQSLSENKATGVDNISAKLLQKAGVAIVDPIAHMINFFFTD